MSVKVALTYIVKDNSELSLFQKSLKSFMPYFDGLFVVVNGLSGQHEKIHQEVKKWKGKSLSISPETHPHVYHKNEDGKWEFVNFAGARQATWDLVTPEFDYISWADTDDLLQGGNEIRKLAQAAKNQNIDTIYCTYYYSCIFNEDGSVKEPVIFHERERLIKNGVYKWTSWLHEVCVPIDGQAQNHKVQKFSHNPKQGVNILWVHTADYKKSSQALERNVRILELQAKDENYKDPRTLLYIAKTYFDIGGNDKLISADKYLDMYLPLSGWDEEIAVAHHYKGLIRQRLGRDGDAIPYYKEAIKIFPRNHIDYLRLADACFKVNRYEDGSIYLAQSAVLPEMESKATIGNPFEVKILFLTLKYQEAQKKGDIGAMEQYAKLRSEYVTDELYNDILKNKELNDVAKGLYNYAIYLLKNSPTAMDGFIETIKKPFVEEEFVMKLSNSRIPKVWADNEIVYYASFAQKHFEEWTPKNLETGIGGSESAVIYLAQEWVKKGFKVTVYCDCGNNAGNYDGVEYKHYNTVNFHDQFSTIIFWRSPHLLDLPMLKAKRIFMDLHDIADMTHWTPERVKKVDKIFFKSKWHRRNLPNIPNDKAVVISNGINL
jgi:tetratricopeptide (TPR) repeat protein